MGRRKLVAVAMSGGIDSFVTAYLLKQQGYEVLGITFDFLSGFENFYLLNEQRRKVFIENAHKAAEYLKVPHKVINLGEKFQNLVVQPFLREYFEGKTPNPCIWCNRKIKFGILWESARENGADYLATGHYARVRFDSQSRRYRLFRGSDLKKDQSYFLWTLDQEILSRTLMPLGDFRKSLVRRIADNLGFLTSGSLESQDICFIMDGSYSDFIRFRYPEAFKPGPILDVNGREIGRHEGLPLYTVGQRKRLRVSSGSPRYVVGIDFKANALIVGTEEDLRRKKLLIREVNWVNGRPGSSVIFAEVKIRYQGEPAFATITVSSDEVEIEFREYQRAITPGQSAVIYQGEELVGGGIIARSL